MIMISRIHDKLNAHEWWFTIIDAHSHLKLKLQKYLVLYKDNERQRNWRTSAKYDSFDKRAYNSTIKVEDVPIPEDVISEAKKMILDRIIIEK